MIPVSTRPSRVSTLMIPASTLPSPVSTLPSPRFSAVESPRFSAVRSSTVRSPHAPSSTPVVADAPLQAHPHRSQRERTPSPSPAGQCRQLAAEYPSAQRPPSVRPRSAQAGNHGSVRYTVEIENRFILPMMCARAANRANGTCAQTGGPKAIVCCGEPPVPACHTERRDRAMPWHRAAAAHVPLAEPATRWPSVDCRRYARRGAARWRSGKTPFRKRRRDRREVTTKGRHNIAQREQRCNTTGCIDATQQDASMQHNRMHRCNTTGCDDATQQDASTRRSVTVGCHGRETTLPAASSKLT
jgi:hypothetical protein